MPSKGQMKSTTLLVPSDGESSSEEEFEVENIVDCRVNEVPV